MTHLSIGQLKEAIQIKEQIETLEGRLRLLLGGKAPAGPGPGKRGRPKPSAAKTRGVKASAAAAAPVAKTAKKKGGLTNEGRAKLSAAMKARWAARKKGAPAPNASS